MMQSTISCDRVFDALTAQPFPTGSPNDVQIEAHLLACHECRRLAESLRPATNLLRESLRIDTSNTLSIPMTGNSQNRIAGQLSDQNSDQNGDQNGNLPSFAGFANEEQAIGSLMEQVRAIEEKQHQDRWTQLRSDSDQVNAKSEIPKFVAVALVAAAAIVTLVVSQNFASGGSDSFANDAERVRYLASCGAPTACLSKVGWNSLSNTNLANPDTLDKACCTECHNATQSHPSGHETQPTIPHLSQHSVPLLAKSCRACHAVNN